MLKKKYSRLISKFLTTCILTMSIAPGIPVYATEQDNYLETDTVGIATSSNATKKEQNQNKEQFSQRLPSNDEIQEWLDETQDPTDITLSFTLDGVKYLDNGNNPVPELYALEDEDASGFEFAVTLMDLDGNKIADDIVLSDEDKINYETYELDLNTIYKLEVSEIPDTKDGDDRVYEYDSYTYTFYLLPTTYDVMNEIYGTSPSVVADEPEYVIAVREYEWNDWFASEYDDESGIWYLAGIDFYNRVSEAVKFRFDGKKDYYINDRISDPSKFEFTIEEESPRDEPKKADNYNSGGSERIRKIEVSCDEEGNIDYPIHKVSTDNDGQLHFRLYESTKQPANTAIHTYEYDDTVYEYIVAWLGEENYYGTVQEEYEPGLYYGIITNGDISAPIKAELGDDGVYIIPDNDFLNKETIQGSGIKLSGYVDYKVNGKKADASGFRYRLTGWPDTNGYVGLTCDENGNIQFPDSIFLGYDSEMQNTITVFQISEQPSDTDDMVYSYDPSVYQFKLDFVTKEIAISYGIDESMLSEVETDYVLVYKDYRDLTWKLAEMIDGDFVISGINFINRSDSKETDTFTVQFNTLGGGCLPAYTDIKKGNLIKRPENPVKEGFEFAGWFKDEAFASEWDFSSDVVESNIILYAKWNKKDTSSGSGSTIHGSSSGGSSHSSSAVSTINDPGWFKDNGIWYYKDYRTNTLKKGWHLDPNDNYWYYLDLNDGHMYIGWNLIDGKWYYFNPEELAPNQTWFKNSSGRWYYNNTKQTKPFGSMYANENTPDGFAVNEKGEFIQ